MSVGNCSLIQYEAGMEDLRTEGSVDGNALHTRFSRLCMRSRRFNARR